MKRESTFDNLGNAMKVLFSISQVCAWTTPMYQSTYAVGADMVQKQFANRYRSIYFIVFVVILNFFIVNLFVGVIVSAFNT